MAKDTATFFSQGTSTQFEQVLALYPQAIRMKAEIRAKKAEELIKLDNWYQNELPKKIKSRGKDAHMIHEELVQCMKWKQSRGKFFPQLSYLIKVNTPRMVILETKKAFRKLPNNIEQAITALINLKGVGTTMASALLAAASPETAAFMADECLMAIPEIEGIDYTTKEYLKFSQHIRNTCDRLNKPTSTSATSPHADTITWTPHKVELAVWTHFIVSEMKPGLLTGEIPSSVANGTSSGKTSPILGLLGSTNGNGENSLDAASSSSSGSGCGLMLSDDGSSNQGVDGLVGNHLEKNGKGATTPGSTASSTPHLLSPPIPDEDTNTTNTSYTEDSMDTMPTVPPLMTNEGDETNDSILSDSTTNENSGSTGGTVGEGRKIGSVGIGMKRARPEDVGADSSVNLYDETANDAAPLPLTCKRPRQNDDVQTSPVSLALPKTTEQTPDTN